MFNGSKLQVLIDLSQKIERKCVWDRIYIVLNGTSSVTCRYLTKQDIFLVSLLHWTAFSKSHEFNCWSMFSYHSSFFIAATNMSRSQELTMLLPPFPRPCFFSLHPSRSRPCPFLLSSYKSCFCLLTLIWLERGKSTTHEIDMILAGVRFFLGCEHYWNFLAIL